MTGPTVAIVGGREHSGDAHDVTIALARDLARAGVTIISGIDQGVEATAHRSALDAGGRTIAVMPGAPQLPYSRHHQNLHRQILTRGAAVSEFPHLFQPIQHWSFIASQRILAAIADVVVIVETRGRVSAMPWSLSSPPRWEMTSRSCPDASPIQAAFARSGCSVTGRTLSPVPRTCST